MEENILVKKKKKSNKNKIVSLLLVVGLIVMVIGVSYAYFAYYRTGLYTYTLNGGKMNVIYSETTGNNISISNAFPMSDKKAEENAVDFEFTVTGFNESEDNIYYAIEIDYGSVNETKTRLLDSDMKLSLYENGEEVFKNEIFNNLNKQDIHYGYISYGTDETTPVTNTYLLKIWINDNVLITNTPNNLNTEGRSVYSTSEFANTYASFKVNIRADLTYDSIGYLTYDANGGSFTPTKTSLTTGKVTTQKPVMENKGFLGWSGSKNGEVEFKAGDTYTGDYDVLYAVYGDTRNVMGSFPSTIKSLKTQITEVYFIDDIQSNIDTRYNASSIKEDLTYNSQGSIKGWLEEDYLDEETTTQYYKLYVGSEGTTYLNTGRSLFDGWTNVITIDFTSADTSSITSMYYMFSGCKSLTELDVGNFNTTQVTNMSDIFEQCSNLIELDVRNFDTRNVTNMHSMFRDCESLTELDVSNFDTSNVTDMSYMFFNCSCLIELDVRNFNTGNVLNISYMFYHCDSLTTLDVGNFNTTQVTSMSSMFCGCSSLEVLDVSNFDTSSVTNMTQMFISCSVLTELDVSNFDTSNVENMSRMFEKCSGLKKIDVSNFDTSNVTDMASMFYSCSNLTKIDVSNWDTSKVTTMSQMFSVCRGLTELDVSNFDTKNVTTISWMFGSCENLKTLDVSHFDTSNVLSMRGVFSSCNGLTKLDVSRFATSQVTDMSQMFFSCNGLTKLDVSNFDMSNVTNAMGMFEACDSITKLDLSKWDTSSLNKICTDISSPSLVQEYHGMFWKCSSLTYLEISSFDFSKITYYQYAFYGMPVSATIYVKDTTNQSLVLGIDTAYRPAWTNANVLINNA